jgi:hypothetical protein
MGGNSKAIALWVAKSAFEGLAPLLFEYGMTIPEAEKLLRAVCVHSIAKQLRHGRRVLNDSQISIRMGVNRHVVAKLLERAPLDGVRVRAGRAAMMRVVHGWEAEYLAQGQRRELPVGDLHSVGPSVWALVQRYAPGVYPRGIIDEMIRVELVQPIANGQLRLKSSGRSTSEPNAHELEQATQRMQDVMRATFHDFSEPKTKRVWREFQSEEIDVADLPIVRKMLTDRLDSMMERLADELNSPRLQRNSTGRKVRLGAVGLIVEEALAQELDDESDDGAEDIKPKMKSRTRSRVKLDKVRRR